MSDARPLVITGVALGAGLLAVWGGFAALSLDRLIMGVGAVVLFALVFLRTEFGLYVLIFSMLLSPEFSLGGQLAERREAAIRAEDVLLVVIGLAWLAKTAVNKEIGLVVKTPLNRPILVYIASQLIATLLGMVVGTVRTTTGLVYVVKYIEYFLIYYMVTNNVEDRLHAWRLVGAAFVTAAIVSVHGLLQIPKGQRVSAPFEGDAGEPNTFGGYLLMMIAVAAGLAFEARSIRARVAYTGLLAVMVVPFLYTLSRASYLAVVPMVLALVVLFPRRRLLLAVVAGIAVIVAMVAPPQAIQKRVTHTFEPSQRFGDKPSRFDSSTTERLESYEAALEAWARSPILGRGVTGFRFIDAQYPRLLVESGIVGFAAFVWLIAALVLAVGRVWRDGDSPPIRGLAGGFLAAIIGILVHAIGSNSFIIIRIMEPFWLFAALVLTMHRVPEREVPTRVPQPQPWRNAPARSV
ncbi:MAG TPA: O-antigen ligase family protein [Terriglobales bacterium]|nr:O-antigen ligase family protein [Terriglobales bacterium]